MVDNLSGGRLIAGFLRGTPHEFLTYGFNPDESRERMNEGIELILKAWTEPEPFGWEGIYYRFRTIAVSPRVVQLPYPRVMVSGNSIDSLNFAAAHRFDIGFSLANPVTCGEHFAHYKAAAAAQGWTPSADNALYRHHCYVAETDAKAAEDVERHAFWASHGGHRNQEAIANAVAAQPRSTSEVIGALSAQLGRYGKNSAIDMSIPPIIGAPETVIRRIREIAAIGQTGRFDLVFRSGRLPEELVESSLHLFGKEVMPVLQKAAA